MRKYSIAMLMAATVLAPPALAQSDQNQTAATEGACQDLTAYVQRNDTDETGITADRAQRIANEGDLQTCHAALRMARGEISQIEGEENYDAEATARLRVFVPEPQVTVEQSAAEVQVEQREPQVAVNPGQPRVTVNQAEPVVRVQTQPPKITIDMPKPEILVEMPDPNVDVAMRQPRVTVNQPEPQVSVEQGQPRVEMGQQQTAEDSDQAQVNVQQQDQTTVQVDKADQARVQVEDVRPQVRYNTAEPRIEVEEAGEPQIAFNQPGEANVRFRQMTAEETQAAAEERRDAVAGYRADAREPEVGERTEAADQGAEQQATAEQSQAAVTQGRQQDDAQTATTDQEQAATQAPAADTGQAGDQDVAQETGQETGDDLAQTTGQDTGFSVVNPQERADTADQAAATETVLVSRLRDMAVLGATGDTIGDVDEILLRNGETYLIVGAGGFLGLGQKDVALPLSDMTIRGDTLVMRQITDEEVENMQEFDRTEFQPVADEQSVEIRSE